MKFLVIKLTLRLKFIKNLENLMIIFFKFKKIKNYKMKTNSRLNYNHRHHHHNRYNNNQRKTIHQ